MTAIQWTEKTWNPVVGCSRISEGCRHCYAEVMAARIANAAQARLRAAIDAAALVGLSTTAADALTSTQLAYRDVVRWERGGKRPADQHDKALPRWNGEVRLLPDVLTEPLRRKVPTIWFANSMADLFHEGLSDPDIAAVFGVMAATPWHTYQALTKRSGRMPTWFADVRSNRQRPLPNLWLGVSCEDQQRADERIPPMLETPAAVRWVSAEPLLGPVDFARLTVDRDSHYVNAFTGAAWDDENGGLPEAEAEMLDWVVVGGESGPGARPCKLKWLRDIVDQCREAGVPCFVKQLGTVLAREMGLRDSKGGDPEEWPEDLRIREYPEGAQ